MAVRHQLQDKNPRQGARGQQPFNWTDYVFPKRVYDAIQHVYVQIPVYINRSIWTYNFGPTSLIYTLTCRENRLDKVETGGYGR